MSETVAFGLILVGLALAPAAAYLLARRSQLGAGVAIAAGFAGLGAQLVCSWRPDAVAPLIAGTDLALFYPAAGMVPAVGGLVALAMRTDERNRRAVLFLCAIFAGYGAWQAGALLADPAASLGGGGHWKGDCYIQSTGWSCAPSASVSLLRGLGIEATEAEMAGLMCTRASYGTNLLNMDRGLSKKLAGRGFRTELRSLGYDDLVAAKEPGLASIRLSLALDHAVALVAADADGVVLLDPLVGRRCVGRADFEREWLSQAILVRRTGS